MSMVMMIALLSIVVDEAPFGPGAVVDAHALAAQQVREYEPGGGRASADGAVRDQFVAAVQHGRGEHVAQFGHGAERPVGPVQVLDGLVDRGRYVADSAAWLHGA